MKEICDNFHKLYEKNRIWENTTWLGINIQKFPADAFIIQELIFKIRPDYIIETGTNFGGSTLFYASIMELMQQGKVITIDVDNKMKFPNLTTIKLRDRIRQFTGSSVDFGIVNDISAMVRGRNNMVILDSWHSKEHVLKELNLYSPLVPVGSYIIVEDSHVNGHPIKWKWGGGPYEAIQQFLKSNNTFKIDKSCEKLLITYNPSGFLKKVYHGGKNGNT